MRFIHTADWQIGKPFKQFGERESVLKQARLTVIARIADLAKQQGAEHVLVAGDIYDAEAPTPRTLLEPLERMRGASHVHWHLIPGNHDPHRPHGLWDRVLAHGLPPNVTAHLAPSPAPLGREAMLLPAPLTRKTENNDLTTWMDSAETAPGLLRIGLAHGSVTGFGSGGEAGNPIDPRRPQQAGLAYLALGDWHRTMQIGSALWYAGTPEPDRAGSQETGQVLVVDIFGPGAQPTVTPHAVGSFRWLTRDEHLTDSEGIASMDARLRMLDDLPATILRLRLDGALSLAARTQFDKTMLSLSAALFHLDADTTRLANRPTDDDLEAIDFGGVLHHAARRLRAMADDEALTLAERHRASEALVLLYTRVADTRMPAGD